jgi:lysophospholipase L1-like esterase
MILFLPFLLINVKSFMPKKYLALGDSYTIGEAVEQNESFPYILVNKLRSDNINIDDPVIIAKTGWTTDELESAINSNATNSIYDLVTLLIGVNNQYRGRSADEFRIEFCRLLARAIAFSGGKPSNVVVLSIPDWGVTPFAEGKDRNKIAAEIDEFNEIIRSETQKESANYIDVTVISRLAADDISLLAGDKLHPSAKMYKLWVESLYNIVKQILTE